MIESNKKRIRRSMLFLSAQKPGLIKAPYIYKPDTIIFDLEDAVAENQKDAARFSLFHALSEINYHNCEKMVRINGLNTPHWQEDIRVSVACGADSIRIPKVEKAQDVQDVEAAVLEAEKEFNVQEGHTLLMAAIESAKGVVNIHQICSSSQRMLGIALSGGDYTKDLQITISGTGIELNGARQLLVIAARAAGIQCFDTVFTNLNDMESFEKEVSQIKIMGFDGKSLINPRQIKTTHRIFTPSEQEVEFAKKVVTEIESKQALGIGVFTVDDKMIDIAFYDGAKRTLSFAKASGMFKGEL